MLELDWVTITFEIANFLLLTALLYHFLFKPVVRNVQARAAEKARLIRETVEDHQAAAEARARVEERLAALDREAATIMANAQQQLEEERAIILQETQAEVERMLAEAHLEAYRQRQQAVRDFHDDLVNAILETSGRVISRTASPQLHDALVQQLNDHIWAMGRNGIQQIETIRRSLKDRAPIAYVTSAQPLSAEQQRRLLDTLTALADHNVKLELETDPALGSGLRVRLGDTVMDSSIAGQLAKLRYDISTMVDEQLAEETSRPNQSSLEAQVINAQIR